MVDGVFDDHAVMARLARLLDDVLGAAPVLETRVDDERVFDAEVERDHAGFRVLVVPGAVGVGVRLGGARVVGGEEDVAPHRASLEAAREDAANVGGAVVHDERLASGVDHLRVAEPPAEGFCVFHRTPRPVRACHAVSDSPAAGLSTPATFSA